MNEEEALAGLNRCFEQENARALFAMVELARAYKELRVTHLKSDEVLGQQYLKMALENATFVVEQRRKQSREKHPQTWSK